MTVIVPIDFSAQAINAAAFATHMLANTPNAELVLYHLFVDEKEEARVIEKLFRIRSRLQELAPLKIRTVHEKGDGLPYFLTRLINREDADLVVMAVSDRVRIFEGSYSLQMMNQHSCPVLVVPYGYLYNDVRNVALASDFHDILHTIPVAKVKKMLSLFAAQLHIVHVNPEIYVSLTPAMQEQRELAAKLFAEFRPQFHFIGTEDFTETMTQFIEDKNIDLVITFPRPHSYLHKLMKGTNTEKLVNQNAVPVLAAHE